MKRLFVSMSVFVLLLMGACTSMTTTSTETPVVTPAAIQNQTNFEAAVAKTRPSVVTIELVTQDPTTGQQQRAAGTGWVIDSKGFIATNEHVVSGASLNNITITSGDGTKFTPTGVQTDSSKDLAVLKINTQSLLAAGVGDSSKLVLGQPVATIGNALDLGIRVTTGVVSLLDVTMTYQSNNLTLSGLIETDAIINPGNSGGVLIDMSGNVMGITNGGLEGSSTDVEGFGYAININDAMPVLKSLMSKISG